jgi:hypothetical protein
VLKETLCEMGVGMVLKIDDKIKMRVKNIVREIGGKNF